MNGHSLATGFDVDAAEDFVLAAAQGQLDLAKIAEQQASSRAFVPLFLTDSPRHETFRRRGYNFEYFPRPTVPPPNQELASDDTILDVESRPADPIEQESFYRVVFSGVRDLRAYLDRFWTQALASFRRAAERETDLLIVGGGTAGITVAARLRNATGGADGCRSVSPKGVRCVDERAVAVHRDGALGGRGRRSESRSAGDAGSAPGHRVGSWSGAHCSLGTADIGSRHRRH